MCLQHARSDVKPDLSWVLAGRRRVHSDPGELAVLPAELSQFLPFGLTL